MADRPPDPDPAERGDGYAGTPTWVKAFGILAALVLLLVGFMVFSGLGGSHGPQRHEAVGERSSGLVEPTGHVTAL